MADPPELHEDVELDLERRRFVLGIFARLDALTYYEILVVARHADKQAIKRAYFQLSRAVHPDRYFGKRLGTYKPKLEAIFARMTVAYETLSDPTARAAYDATLPAAGDGAPRPPVPAAPVDPAVAARKQAALDGLKQRLAESKAKAEQHAQAAARALAAGDLIAAAEAYRQALVSAPNDPALRAASEKVKHLVLERSCEASRRQAALEERHGHWEQAVASWRRVLAILPGDLEARARLAAAEALVKGKRP
jgi:curved DNA-binding protein CbpA